ncbi:helix-turn-helix transcriptional regulator [Microbacterium sp. NPDC078428]|uniref:helix-turn-helix transcriptional regulator n=1 Tax=Microbacterium sp. NPDC078428 TaxID=3364190 RepID=UPI0037C55882
MPQKITPEERLLSLTVALMANRYGLTKEQILSSVSGYREARAEGRSADALEKMFERDKDALRELGMPVHTLGDAADPDDLREARYVIPKAEYVLPEDIVFTPAEVAILGIAAAVWGESSMSGEAQSALRKIRALGIDVDEPIIGFAPRLSAKDHAFPALRAAHDAHRVVRFTYVKPGDDVPRVRTVEPHALIDYDGRWHLYGFDRDLAQERTFLLSRIVGDVEQLRDRFDPAAAAGAGERARRGLDEVARRNSALVRVQEDSEAALRLRRRGSREDDLVRIPFVDVHVLADELASYGPEVTVVSPDDLRAQVVERLQRTLAAHGVTA